MESSQNILFDCNFRKSLKLSVLSCNQYLMNHLQSTRKCQRHHGGSDDDKGKIRKFLNWD